MANEKQQRGGAPVEFIDEFDHVEASAILFLRQWCEGTCSRARIGNERAAALGPDRARTVFHAFEDICRTCAIHGRRPLMRHGLSCKCVGADESCFANFVAYAANGQREDAFLLAATMVRPDVEPILVYHAFKFGIGLKQIPRHSVAFSENHPTHQNLH